MTRTSLLGAGLALALLPVLLAGCGGGGSSAPTGSSSGSGGTGGSSTPFTATSADGRASVAVPANDGLTSATVAPSAAASLPASTGLVSGTAYDFGPSGKTFSKPVTLTIHYDPAQLPAGASENGLAIFTVTNGDWARVDGSAVDTSAHTVSAPVSHFSTYGILAPNTFAGLYTGHYGGSSSGAFTMTISQSGTLKVSGTDPTGGPFAGTGSLSLTGAADVTASGGGTTGTGATFTFQGTFSNPTGGQVIASGTWSDTTGEGGDWAIP